MASIEQIIQREDGSEVKIVAQEFFGTGLTRSVGVHVLRRENPDSNWTLCSDRPHPDWRSMPVEEYVKRGRSEMLQTVSIGEILKVVDALRKLHKTFPEADPESPNAQRHSMRLP